MDITKLKSKNPFAAMAISAVKKTQQAQRTSEAGAANLFAGAQMQNGLSMMPAGALGENAINGKLGKKLNIIG